jgi:hypothetical protein
LGPAGGRGRYAAERFAEYFGRDFQSCGNEDDRAAVIARVGDMATGEGDGNVGDAVRVGHRLCCARTCDFRYSKSSGQGDDPD